MYTHYIVSFFLTLFLSFSINYIFRQLKYVDKPDGERKKHKGDIALGGGLVLFFSLTATLFIFYPQHSLGINGHHPQLSTIWFISTMILVMGLIDDIRPMKHVVRIILQVLASWFVILSTDLYLRDLGNLFDTGNIGLGAFGIPITIFMIVGVCNAFNMLDGMDGLVTSLVIIPSTFIAFLNIFYTNQGLLFLPTIILLTFLLFNLGLFGKKWKMFLGDSGSMWIGFLVGWFLVCFSQNETSFRFQPVAALWFILIPLVDALSTFFNRIWQKKSIFEGDRGHLHHILLDSGMAKWKVLLIFISISSAACTVGFLCIVFEVEEYLQFYGFLTTWLFYHLIFKSPQRIS